MNNNITYTLTILFAILFFIQSCAGNDSSDSSANLGQVSDFQKPCASGSQCESQKCIEINDAMGCSQYCYKTGDCPEGFFCAADETLSTNDASSLAGICRPLSDTICDSCTTDTQCSEIAGKCKNLETSGTKYCLMDCRLDSCPEGFTCSDLSGSKYCLPDTNDCSCNLFKEGNTLSCSIENEYGQCTGIKTCMGDAGWTACNAQVPGPEVCDEQDNNCDGNIDEGVIGTIDNCSQCGDQCSGRGITGTQPVCINGENGKECGISCDYENGYYDSNQNTFDGCECHDDTSGAESVEAAVSLGELSSCDFGHQFRTNLIPSDVVQTAHTDYYRFHYRNVWNCVEELEVKLRVLSASKTHTLCVVPANSNGKPDNSKWQCKDVTPGSEESISPYENDGTYYIKVSLKNQGETNCSPYTLTICDGNGC